MSPPNADTTTALKELPWSLCKLETTYPEAAFIVAGDFSKANLRKRMPKFYQHIDYTVVLTLPKNLTAVTATSEMPIRPSSAHPSAKKRLHFAPHFL